MTTGGSENLSETHEFLAGAYLGLGEPATACGHARTALAMAEAASNPGHVGGAWRALGLVAARSGGCTERPGGGDPLTVAECFEASVSVLADAGMEAERARSLWAWGDAETESGDASRGRALRAEAREIFASLNLTRFVAQLDD